jgi:hypothetical protein
MTFAIAKPRLLTLIAIGIALGVIASSLIVTQVYGIAGFGGRITFVTYCLCSGGILLTVGPPSPGQYVFQFGVSQLFPYGQIYRIGPQVLGTYVPGGVCLVYAGLTCTSGGVPIGTIGVIGTSL